VFTFWSKHPSPKPLPRWVHGLPPWLGQLADPRLLQQVGSGVLQPEGGNPKTIDRLYLWDHSM